MSTPASGEMRVTKPAKAGGSRRSLKRTLLYTVATLAGLYSAWPLLVMVLEGYSIDLSPFFSGRGVRLVAGVPFYSGGVVPTPIHYLDAIVVGAFPKLVENSLVVASISIAIALAVGLPVAYILARVDIRGRSAVAYMLLALRTVSPFAVIIPLYVTYSRIGLYDTYTGISLAEDMLVLSVVVWMLRGFFSDIPKEVYDAASLFGKSEGQIFRRVILPMVIPGIVVTALFALVLIWNEFLFAVTLTGPATKTVAVGVWTGMTSNGVNYRSVNWDDLNAAGTLAFVPAVAVMLVIRKYLARGFSLGTAR
jgi:multiple sugar transport system permease protein